jgi:tellurite resistance protein TerC
MEQLFLQASLAESNPLVNTYFIIGFVILIATMMVIDLGVFNKRSHTISNKEALVWTGIWISLAVVFGIFVYMFMGITKASEFYTAYLIEEALSIDNLFVFILVFEFFKVPAQYQHKVLFWGILGAIFFRAIFIFAGAQLIQYTYMPDFMLLGYKIEEFNVLLTMFGLFLLYAGIKSVRKSEDEESDFSKGFAIRLLKKIVPITETYDGGKFFTVVNGKRVATLLFLVVAIVEITDLIFAVDSIPAIFTVSRDPFILYASNIFAILGLRSMYFVLANFMHLFSYLKYGLAFILSFIGVKMIIAPIYHVSSPLSLSIVALALLLSVIASVIWGPETESNKNH